MGSANFHRLASSECVSRYIDEADERGVTARGLAARRSPNATLGVAFRIVKACHETQRYGERCGRADSVVPMSPQGRDSYLVQGAAADVTVSALVLMGTTNTEAVPIAPAINSVKARSRIFRDRVS